MYQPEGYPGQVNEGGFPEDPNVYQHYSQPPYPTMMGVYQRSPNQQLVPNHYGQAGGPRDVSISK